jgi:hypothetical protein
MKKLCTLLALLVATPLAFIGCTDNNTDGLQVDASPTFTYFGRVTDTSAKPLPGVEVCFWFDGKDTCVETEADNDRTAKDEAGTYFIDGVPFDSEVKVTANLTIPAVEDDPDTEDVDESVAAIPFFPVEMTIQTPGDEVIGGGDEVTYQDNTQREMSFVMVAANYTLEAYVFANGAPAAGATMVLDLRDQGFALYTSAVADADGMVSIPGLPTSSLERPIEYEIWVLPYDKDADGSADFGAGLAHFDPFWGPGVEDNGDLFGFEVRDQYWGYDEDGNWRFLDGVGPSSEPSGVLVLNLRGLDGSPDVIYSNVEDGSHTSTDPIEVVFNHVISGAAVSLLRDNYGSEIAITTEVVGGIKLVVTPVKPLAAGGSYLLMVDRMNFPFTVGGVGDVEPITGLVLQSATDVFDYDDPCYNVQWKSDPNAFEYCVYATNDTPASEWNLVDCWDNVDSYAWRLVEVTPGNWQSVQYVTDDNGADQSLTVQKTEVCVPGGIDSPWDTFWNDSEFTPLEGGTQVTFVVTGVNKVGAEGPIAGADTLPVKDTVVPSIDATPNAKDNFVNDDLLATKTVDVCLDFKEYMDQSVEPTATMATGSTATIAGWTWDNDSRGGCFQVVVPKATSGGDADATGEEITFDYDGVMDTSGNAITDLDPDTDGNQTTDGPYDLDSGDLSLSPPPAT